MWLFAMPLLLIRFALSFQALSFRLISLLDDLTSFRDLLFGHEM